MSQSSFPALVSKLADECVDVAIKEVLERGGAGFYEPIYELSLNAPTDELWDLLDRDDDRFALALDLAFRRRIRECPVPVVNRQEGA